MEGRDPRDAGIVDHEIHPPVPADHLLGEPLHLGGATDVGEYADGSELGRGAIERGLLDIGDHHRSALATHRPRERIPDAGGAAGDHGDPADHGSRPPPLGPAHLAPSAPRPRSTNAATSSISSRVGTVFVHSWRRMAPSTRSETQSALT